MNKIVLGELGKYLPESLLEKTNFEEHISQEIVDDFNAKLIKKNPNHFDDYKREWDYAEFTTKKGNNFATFSIYNAAWVNPDFDDLMTDIRYTYNGKKYYVRHYATTTETFLRIGDWESYIMYMKNEEGETIETEGEAFTFLDESLKNTNGQ